MNAYTTEFLAREHIAGLHAAGEADRRRKEAPTVEAEAGPSTVSRLVARVLSVARAGRASGSMTSVVAD